MSNVSTTTAYWQAAADARERYEELQAQADEAKRDWDRLSRSAADYTRRVAASKDIDLPGETP